jgi:tetratricopeptide (TPR) repeat protein
MIHKILSLCLLLTSSLAFSQTSTNQVKLNQTDSAGYFLQKGLDEKAKGRRLESLKYFEKAVKYDASNKAIVSELASAYMDLRRYGFARDTYKKLVELGDNSAATYKQLVTLSFQKMCSCMLPA